MDLKRELNVLTNDLDVPKSFIVGEYYCRNVDGLENYAIFHPMAPP